MGTTANLTNTPEEIITGKDSIVIIDNFQSIRGGVTLDTTGYDPEIINAGHVIIRETSTGAYKPMPLNGNAYDSLPGGHTYAGVLIQSVLKKRPFAGVMVRGTVNSAATPYPMTTILSAFKSAVPLIDWRED